MNAFFKGMKPVLLMGCRVVLGSVFLSAGVIKVMDMRTFIDAVQAYQMLPYDLVIPFAFVVPWIEIIAGGCLILGFWTHSSTCLMVGLLSIFGIGLGTNILRGANMSCGCFGPYLSDTILPVALFRVMILLGISVVLMLSRNVSLSVDRAIVRFWNQKMR